MKTAISTTRTPRILLAAALIALLAILAAPPPAHAQPAKPDAKPNILFILTDNLGYSEIGCYGGGVTRGAATPRIDSLAKSGLRLLNIVGRNLLPVCFDSPGSRGAVRAAGSGGAGDGATGADMGAAMSPKTGTDLAPPRARAYHLALDL